MYKSLFALILFVFFFSVPGFAGNGGSCDPVLSVTSAGESIVGRSLPPGTYRVVPALKPGQQEAGIIVTLVEVDPEKPSIDNPPASGISTKPGQIDTPQSSQTPIPTQSQTKPAEPSGTGPESNCEYGLPKRDGANCEIQLTSGDLPAGLRLDDAFNQNKACEVHQWIMQGPDRKNRIEVNISFWGARAKNYYNWKHGMLRTGQYNQSDLPIGNKQLYVEEKNGCNKQLIMQIGNYLVEIHRPPVDGKTQSTDPISREDFVALAKAVENRIAAVAGIPDKKMLDDNPSEFRWKVSTVWPVSFANGTLKVQGAGRLKWGTRWVVVDTGIQSYRGQGTGAGPVVIYTKDNKTWTVVLLNYATGGQNNKRGFEYRVDIRSVGQYGATLRVAGICYDYSWNHLKKIDCGSGNFTPGGTTPKPPKPNVGDDPNDVQQPDDPNQKPVQTGTTTGGGGLPTTPQVTKLPALPPEPSSMQTPPIDVSTPVPPPPFIRRFWPGLETYKSGTVTYVYVYDTETGKECPSGWSLSNESDDIGHFEGNDFHAEKPGYGWFCTRYEFQAYDDFYKKVVTKSINAATPVRVVPADNPNLPSAPWNTSPNELLFGRVYIMKKTGPEYVDGVRVSLNRVDGRHFDTESKTGKNLAGQNEKGHYGFTGIELGRLPEGTYSIRCYKQTGAVSTDLWHKTEHRVKLPFKQGEKFTQDIELIPAGSKSNWNKYNLDEPNKRLNQ